ncbi:MAG: hypothetical protein ACOY0T_19720 [Myxococcota bacterium]
MNSPRGPVFATTSSMPGGVWRDELLVRDRTWVWSRTPADLFVPAIAANRVFT